MNEVPVNLFELWHQLYLLLIKDKVLSAWSQFKQCINHLLLLTINSERLDHENTETICLASLDRLLLIGQVTIIQPIYECISPLSSLINYWRHSVVTNVINDRHSNVVETFVSGLSTLSDPLDDAYALTGTCCSMVHHVPGF